ncbi:MAG: hypothetical protein KKB90_05435 [Actinobacteria bacterium]|nr:hypothetical protein [Actinomycetota bacterium]MCG2819504.1 hypothetical protein [Actinomycetes bacterium]MBU4218389.1 hypothetical protein [Actinomycetota bacterium]MBU4358767.1 hypothetical protein [Actinomycetota bacterium]MBU4391029.1 hypothetical protein [Actinomycetota bacterium]
MADGKKVLPIDMRELYWALDGKTPREAARTKAGRRKVNDLLKQFENKSERATRAGQPAFDFSDIREELGVPPDIP